MPIINRVRINGQVLWATCQARGGNWVAVCEPLKLTVQSCTWGELMEDIDNTLNMMLKDLVSTNEFPQFMIDHGWELASPLPAQPDNVRFDLPFFTAMVAAHDTKRHLHQ